MLKKRRQCDLAYVCFVSPRDPLCHVIIQWKSSHMTIVACSWDSQPLNQQWSKTMFLFLNKFPVSETIL